MLLEVHQHQAAGEQLVECRDPTLLGGEELVAVASCELQVAGWEAAAHVVDTGEPAHAFSDEDAVGLGIEEPDIAFGAEPVDVSDPVRHVDLPITEP